MRLLFGQFGMALRQRGQTSLHVVLTDVRFGSKADFFTASLYVRFAPKSGHLDYGPACPLSAISGHQVALGLPFNSMRRK